MVVVAADVLRRAMKASANWADAALGPAKSCDRVTCFWPLCRRVCQRLGRGNAWTDNELRTCTNARTSSWSVRLSR